MVTVRTAGRIHWDVLSGLERETMSPSGMDHCIHRICCRGSEKTLADWSGSAAPSARCSARSKSSRSERDACMVSDMGSPASQKGRFHLKQNFKWEVGSPSIPFSHVVWGVHLGSCSPPLLFTSKIPIGIQLDSRFSSLHDHTLGFFDLLFNWKENCICILLILLEF